MSKKILVLGGTRLAREFVERLNELKSENLTFITSLAGRTRHSAALPGTVRVGGFNGVQGLCDYLRQKNISLVVDATHAFAENISQNAAAACKKQSVEHIVLRHPPWLPEINDDWINVSDHSHAVEIIRKNFTSATVLLTVGRQELKPYLSLTCNTLIARTIEPPDIQLPPNLELLIDRGPFKQANEITLMSDRSIDVLVSKNSGGESTYGKILASRVLSIPIVMLNPPKSLKGRVFENVESVIEIVVHS